MTASTHDARIDQADFYDDRYERGYMQDFVDPYEACRVVTIRDTLQRLPVCSRAACWTMAAARADTSTSFATAFRGAARGL